MSLVMKLTQESWIPATDSESAKIRQVERKLSASRPYFIHPALWRFLLRTFSVFSEKCSSHFFLMVYLPCVLYGENLSLKHAFFPNWHFWSHLDQEVILSSMRHVLVLSGTKCACPFFLSSITCIRHNYTVSPAIS